MGQMMSFTEKWSGKAKVEKKRSRQYFLQTIAWKY